MVIGARVIVRRVPDYLPRAMEAWRAFGPPWVESAVGQFISRERRALLFRQMLERGTGLDPDFDAATTPAPAFDRALWSRPGEFDDADPPLRIEWVWAINAHLETDTGTGR